MLKCYSCNNYIDEDKWYCRKDNKVYCRYCCNRDNFRKFLDERKRIKDNIKRKL